VKRDSPPYIKPPMGVSEAPISIREKLRGARRQFSFARRLSLVGAIVVMGFGLYYAHAVHERHAPAALEGYRMQASLEQSASLLRDGLLLGMPGANHELDALWAQKIWPALETLERHGIPRNQYNLLRDSLAELEAKQLAVLELGGESAETLAPSMDRLHGHHQQARALLESLAAVEAHHLRLNVRQLSAVAVIALLLVLLLTLMNGLATRNLARMVSTAVIAPVQVLEGGAAQLAAGNLNEDLPVHSNDELGRLARSLNQVRLSLAFAELKYRSLFAHTSNSMVLLSPDHFKITDANRSFEILTGMKRRTLIGRGLLELFDEEQREQVQEALQRALENRQETVTGLIMTTPTRLMVVLDAGISVVQISSEQVMEVSFKDMTEQYVKNQALTEIAFKDELTGLFNHRSFYQRLSEEIYQAQTQNHDLVLLFVDLDNFKRCNDTFGHQVGDHLLRSVGQIVQEHIRQDRDAGFRYGGDEFAILLPEAPVQVAQRIAEQVRQGFEGVEQYGTTMSIGVAQWREPMDAEAFVKAADEALYAAKSAGKNVVRLYEPQSTSTPAEN